MILQATLDNPIPPQARVVTVTTDDGRSLRTARFLAQHTPSRGTVVLLQGRAETIEKYFEVITELQARGFAVVAFDWRGQGGSDRPLSDPRKGHLDDFTEYDRDLDAVMRAVALPDSPGPFYILAHSMGGAVALRAAETGRIRYRRMVLSAPMIRLSNRWPGHRLAQRVSATMSGIGLSDRYVLGGGKTIESMRRFDANQLTHDRDRYERASDLFQIAPHLGIGSPTYGWVNAACVAMERFAAHDYPARINVPTLMVAPANDHVVSVHAIEDLALSARAASHVLIAGARHEVLMEADVYRAQFWAAFDAFIPGADELAYAALA